MSRVFKIHAINSDGSDAEEKLIPFPIVDEATGKPYLDEQGEPEILILLRPISPAKYRQVEQQHTERRLNKKTRAMEDVTDWAAVQDELVAYAVQSWTGIVGADDKPLECVYDAKIGLPGDLKNDLIKRASQGEAVNAAASFRATA